MKTNKDKFKEEYHKIMDDYLENYDKIDLVKVVWKDANTISGSASYQDIKERGLLRAETIGYLVYEDEESIAICGFFFPDRNLSIVDPQSITTFRDVHVIPKSWIQSIVSLKIDFEESKKLKERYLWLEKGGAE